MSISLGNNIMAIKAAIVSIGDELMNGFTIDSNSSWIARNILIYDTIKICSKVTAGDNSDNIRKIINDLLTERYKYIFITGGLGPTHDDITKHTLCDYFNCELKLNEEYYNELLKLYSNKKSNLGHLKDQAKILDIGKPIKNNFGTALGMVVKSKQSYIFIMPGVPREMKGMMNNFILPDFFDKRYKKVVNHSTILTTGVYESKLSILLKDILKEKTNFKIAFLPSYTGVKIRLSSKRGFDNDRFLEFKKKIVSKIDKYVYGYDNDKIECVVARLLVQNKLSISIAESCTGGYISKILTDISGSSKYFKGSLVTYSNESKENLLNIDNCLLKEHGAVSKQVALNMAISVKDKFNTDISIATTGISGPDGGTKNKPVGYICICVIYKKNQIVKEFNLVKDRLIHRQVAAHVSLNMLRQLIK